MDLEHIGEHCSHPGCNMKDFLPFHCDICKSTFCLEHRTYASHACSGAFSRDKISIECPMCKESIRLTKADNPDEVWQQHYFNGCNHGDSNNNSNSSSKAGGGSTPPLHKCAKPNCRTVLGPSNTMQCSKCNQEVCLSHRLPEEHDCRGIKGTSSSGSSLARKADAERRLAALAGGGSKSTSKPSSGAKAQTGSYKNGSGGTSKFNTGPTVYDTAERRKPSTATATSFTSAIGSTAGANNQALPPPAERGEVFVCPECAPGAAGGRFSDALLLLAHMERGVHTTTAPPPAPTSAPASVSSGSSSNGSEVCPQCAARFSDVMELIAHVEAAHSAAAVGGGRYAGAINNRSTSSTAPAKKSSSCTPS